MSARSADLPRSRARGRRCRHGVPTYPGAERVTGARQARRAMLSNQRAKVGMREREGRARDESGHAKVRLGLRSRRSGGRGPHRMKEKDL